MNGRALLRCFILFVLLSGCSPDENLMHDGYYSAVAAAFNKDGWKEFITLYVYNNRIVTVEYNARNASGLVRSWDAPYLRQLKEKTGVHPNLLIREYSRELLGRQDPEGIRRVKGDGRFYDIFKTLASAAIAQAKAGDKTVLEVPVAEAGPETP